MCNIIIFKVQTLYYYNIKFVIAEDNGIKIERMLLLKVIYGCNINQESKILFYDWKTEILYLCLHMV